VAKWLRFWKREKRRLRKLWKEMYKIALQNVYTNAKVVTYKTQDGANLVEEAVF
jgi:hypothetical protein